MIMNKNRTTKLIVRIAQPIALILALLMLLIPYAGEIKQYAFKYGNASNGATIDESTIHDNFFERIERLEHLGVDYILEILFLVFFVISLVLAVLACIEKMPLFRKVYFAIPNLTALVLLLWIAIDKNNVGYVYDSVSLYGYMINISVSYALFNVGTIAAILLLLIAIALKVVDSLGVLDKLLQDRAEWKSAGSDHGIKIQQAEGGVDELEKYKKLLDAGIITQAEFDAKKRQILGL